MTLRDEMTETHRKHIADAFASIDMDMVGRSSDLSRYLSMNADCEECRAAVAASLTLTTTARGGDES